jgi:hypothetical protein
MNNIDHYAYTAQIDPSTDIEMVVVNHGYSFHLGIDEVIERKVPAVDLGPMRLGREATYGEELNLIGGLLITESAALRSRSKSRRWAEAARPVIDNSDNFYTDERLSGALKSALLANYTNSVFSGGEAGDTKVGVNNATRSLEILRPPALGVFLVTRKWSKSVNRVWAWAHGINGTLSDTPDSIIIVTNATSDTLSPGLQNHEEAVIDIPVEQLDKDKTGFVFRGVTAFVRQSNLHSARAAINDTSSKFLEDLLLVSSARNRQKEARILLNSMSYLIDIVHGSGAYEVVPGIAFSARAIHKRPGIKERWEGIKRFIRGIYGNLSDYDI